MACTITVVRPLVCNIVYILPTGESIESRKTNSFTYQVLTENPIQTVDELKC